MCVSIKEIGAKPKTPSILETILDNILALILVLGYHILLFLLSIPVAMFFIFSSIGFGWVCLWLINFLAINFID